MDVDSWETGSVLRSVPPVHTTHNNLPLIIDRGGYDSYGLHFAVCWETMIIPERPCRW